MNEPVKIKVGNQDVELITLGAIRIIVRQEVNRQICFVLLGMLIGYGLAHIL